MSRLVKLVALSAVMIAASVFAAPKSAEAHGYGYGYSYGYRPYVNYYRPYVPVYPVYVPTYSYGFCY